MARPPQPHARRCRMPHGPWPARGAAVHAVTYTRGPAAPAGGEAACLGPRFGCPGPSATLQVGPREESPRPWMHERGREGERGRERGCSMLGLAAGLCSSISSEISPALYLLWLYSLWLYSPYGYTHTTAGVVLISSETSPARVMNAAASAASQTEAWRHYSIGMAARSDAPPLQGPSSAAALPQVSWLWLWRLWATRHTQEERPGHGAPSLGLGCSSHAAASSVADSTAFDLVQAWPRRRGMSSCRASPRSISSASSRVSRRPTR